MAMAIDTVIGLVLKACRRVLFSCWFFLLVLFSSERGKIKEKSVRETNEVIEFS